MGAYKVMAIAPVALGALLSSASGSHTNGTLRWELGRRSVSEGRGDVVTAVVDCDGARLKMSFPWERTWAPTLAYIVNDVPARRLCVNGRHNGLPVGTHIHTYMPRAGGEEAKLANDFPHVPIGIPLGGDELRDIFEAFATACAVDVRPECWIDPPNLEVD